MKKEELIKFAGFYNSNYKCDISYDIIDKYISLQPVTAKTEQENWTINKVIDFVNWHLKVCQLPERYELENQSIIDSFLNGDTPELWHNKYFGEQEKLSDVAKTETDIGKIVDMPELNENELKHGIASILSVNKGYPIRELADRILAYVKYQIKQTEQEKPSAQPIAYEFHCIESGHCYVDYIRRTELEHSDETYVQKPLFYASQKHLPTDEEANNYINNISGGDAYKYRLSEFWKWIKNNL